MFTKTADYYDAIYQFKDYNEACNKITTFVQEKNPKAANFLDVGCGTGKHLAYLKENFTVEGLDLNNELLAVARDRCPDVPFHHGDMTAFQLDKTFDVVACLFSSIAYVQTVDALNKSVAAMEKHLSPKGLLIIEPWITPEKYWVGRVTANFVDQPELKIAWMYTSEVEDKKSIFDIHYMVGTPAGIEQFNEMHVMGLWTDEEYRQAFTNAGLEAHYDEKGFFGRGMYYASKP